MIDIKKIIKLASIFEKRSYDYAKEESLDDLSQKWKDKDTLMDSSFIIEGIAQARANLIGKWRSKDETLHKVMRLSNGRLSEINVNQVQKEILDIIANIPCEILPSDEFDSETNEPKAEGVFFVSRDKIYIRQPTVSWAKILKSYENVTYYTGIVEHEISHAIYNFLKKKRIYTDSRMKRTVIPEGKKFSKNEYIYSADEMVSRMNSVRRGFGIQSFTQSRELAEAFFIKFGIPYTIEGKYHKIDIKDKYIVGNPPIIHYTLDNLYQEISPESGWEVAEMCKLLVPYVKKIESKFSEDFEGKYISVYFDLEALVRAMNQVAINKEDSDSNMEA